MEERNLINRKSGNKAKKLDKNLNPSQIKNKIQLGQLNVDLNELNMG